MIDQDQVIRRILRVNHAGEHGAVAIYQAQIAGAKNAELVSWLRETLSHERRHRDAFRAAMPGRGAKPCRLMAIWSVGGLALGRATALFGNKGILICTAAVERTVHRHLEEQISFLSGRDGELADIIRDIKRDEDAHLFYAEAHHDAKASAARLLSMTVSALTELLIWISTRGDSLKLRAALSGTPARRP